MAWLRVDDGFDTHAKMLELTEVQRWRWTRVLIYCARHQTQGRVTLSVLRDIGLGRLAGKLVEVGLLENAGPNAYLVHDWRIYNGSVGDKVYAFLCDNPDATANEVFKAVGGRRDLVLSEVGRYRSGTEVVPGTGTAVPATGTQSGTKSGTHARAPQPQPQEIPRAVGPLEDPDDEPDIGASTAQERTLETLTPALRDLP